jgi:hypothetical protein
MTHKGRKIRTLIGTCLAAALPGLALASPPSNAAVGQIDAILNFCAKAVPHLEKSAQVYRTLLTGNAAPGARGSSAYKQNYDLVSDALAKGNQALEIAACTTGLTQPKPRDDGHGRR